MEMSSLKDCIIPNGIKSVMKDEEKCFSPWVVEHLQEISDVINVPFGNVIETEKRVGRYEADIVVNTKGIDDEDDLVIIENQFGKSNHDHLGKSLTYMTNLNAKILIWISDSFSDEHKNAIASLNKMTDTEYSFYAISVKVYIINDSYFYDFDVLVEPDYERKSENLKDKVRSASEANSLQYWNSFLNQITDDEIKSRFRIIRSGRPFSYISFAKQSFSIGIGYSVKGKYSYVSLITRNENTYNNLCSLVKEKMPETDFKERIGDKNNEVLYIEWKKVFSNTPHDNLDWQIGCLSKIYNCVNLKYNN